MCSLIHIYNCGDMVTIIVGMHTYYLKIRKVPYHTLLVEMQSIVGRALAMRG